MIKRIFPIFKEVRLFGSPFSLPSMGYVPPGDAGCGMKMDLYIFESSLYSIVVTIAEGLVSRAKRHLENNTFFLLKNTRFPDLTTKFVVFGNYLNYLTAIP